MYELLLRIFTTPGIEVVGGGVVVTVVAGGVVVIAGIVVDGAVVAGVVNSGEGAGEGTVVVVFGGVVVVLEPAHPDKAMINAKARSSIVFITRRHTISHRLLLIYIIE
jgi:hypothetical protein